jgi:hypothetical protein
MYTHKVDILYYNVYTSFWDILYFLHSDFISNNKCAPYMP